MQTIFLHWVRWVRWVVPTALRGLRILTLIGLLMVSAIAAPNAASNLVSNANANAPQIQAIDQLVKTSQISPAKSTNLASHSASKTVLVLGDSLSAEYGLVRGTGWVPLMAQRLQSEQLDASVINASISGDTTSGGRSRLSQLLATHHPDIVIIELGGNDALRGLSLAATENNILEMIRLSQKNGAQTLLLGMQIPPNYGTQYTRQFASIYPKLAKETGAVLVPFFLEGLQNRQDLFQTDRIHPVSGAQPLLLDNVWPYLKSMLRMSAASHNKTKRQAIAMAGSTGLP
jgi:acyl-CoA thioesterase-1